MGKSSERKIQKRERSDILPRQTRTIPIKESEMLRKGSEVPRLVEWQGA